MYFKDLKSLLHAKFSRINVLYKTLFCKADYYELLFHLFGSKETVGFSFHVNSRNALKTLFCTCIMWCLR